MFNLLKMKVRRGPEEWRDVVGYEGYYEVSNHGRVRSLDRIDSIGANRKGIILSQSKGDGYCRVVLCRQGKMSTKKVHRLVAETFVPNPNDLPQVNHLDEDGENNFVDNLEWSTHTHNVNHGTRTERALESFKESTSETYIITDPNGKTFEVVSMRQFSLDHNLDPSVMYKVAKGKRPQHKGYTAEIKSHDKDPDN